MIRSLMGAASGALLLLPGALAAQEPLHLGSVVQGSLLTGGDTYFAFRAPSAGFLTVVLRGDGEDDLVLSVADAEGQPLPDGRSDQDLGGVTGAEQLVVVVPRAGEYRVRVESFSGYASSFRLGASFLPASFVEVPPDTDGSPAHAIQLEIGASREDAVDPRGGDAWDWYRIPVASAGVLTIITRGQGMGDLRLETFEEGAWGDVVDLSDQDMDGDLANESLTLNVRAGQAVYVRVMTVGSAYGRVPYRISSGLIPG